MRTLLLVLLMLLVAVVSVLSFALPAAAQEGAAGSLDVVCAPAAGGALVLPSNMDTLVTCRATARDTGTVPLRNAQISFVASAAHAIPDSYYFFREVQDGTEVLAGDSQLTYDFGDIAPGEESVIVLDIIIRSSHEFGADVSLLADPGAHEYARQAITGDVNDDYPPGPAIKFYRDATTAPDGALTYHLYVVDGPLDDVRVDLMPGFLAYLTDANGWAGPGQGGHYTADVGSVAGGSGIERSMVIESADRPCGFVRPAVVVRARQDGEERTRVAVGEAGQSGVCTGQGGGGEGGGGLDLPSAGTGATLPAGSLSVRGALLLAVGVLCVIMGLSVSFRRT